jgi:thioredoxin 1
MIEFGASWCGFCQAAQPLITTALGEQPRVRHIKVEDERGKRLGRTFHVKLWPTLVFLADGKEVSRLVRPTNVRDLREALAQITAR